MIGSANDEVIFPVNNFKIKFKFPKSKICKTIELGRFLGKLLGRLLKIALLSVKIVLKSLAKRLLKLLRLTTTSSVVDAGFRKKMFGPGTKLLVISNEEIKDIMEIVKSLESADLLIKIGIKTIKNETNEQRDEFRCMFLDTWYASLLVNMLTGNYILRAR